MKVTRTAARPLVSVVINNYNYGEYVEDAIKSALRQTYPHTEVIVVDDGSTDESVQVIERFRSFVTPLYKSNGGQASALNAGFKATSGDIVCFLDADDVFHRNKVVEVVRILLARPDAGWYFHELKRLQTSEFCHERQRFDTMFPSSVGSVPPSTNLRRRALEGRLPYFPTATSGMCFRRELLTRILPMPEPLENEGHRITSDNYLKYVAAALAPGIMDTSNWAILRLHGANAYTDQPANTSQRGVMVMRLAYWLLREHPELHRLADREFAYGRRIYLDATRLTESNPVISDYMAMLPLRRRVSVSVRSSRAALSARKWASRLRSAPNWLGRSR